MKRIISVLFIILFSTSFALSQVAERKENFLGAYFGPGVTKSGTQVFTTGLRYMNAPHKNFSYGFEADYTQFIGPYGNSDVFGGIGLIRFTPFDNAIFAEVGIQGFKNISNRRNTIPIVIYPYTSFGLRFKITNRINGEFQVRPFTFNYSGATLGTGGEGGFMRKLFFGLTYALD